MAGRMKTANELALKEVECESGVPTGCWSAGCASLRS